MVNFRVPDGVRVLRDDGRSVELTVTMPVDADEFFGRECPSCEQHFRIAADGYQSLLDDQNLWCVYCGHVDEVSSFITEQQMERVKRAASDYATQLVRDRLNAILEKTFGRRPLQPHNSFLQVSFRTERKPFYPKPLPGINEERLIRERVCHVCGLRYAVFGEHRFCPVCGRLSPLVTALDALASEVVRLDVLRGISPTTCNHLRESGVLDRTYTDTIKNVVSIVESMAKRVFYDQVSDAKSLLHGQGQVFQRLDDLAELFERHTNINVREGLGTAWVELLEIWAARHVFVHCDGVIDARYLTSIPNSPLLEGQRLRVAEHFVRKAINHTERLCLMLEPDSVR